MDMFFQSIVDVEVYFQTVTVQERRGVCEYVLQDHEATAVWENLHTLSIAGGRWKISPADTPRVEIDANSTGDVTITTSSHVFQFPEPYMEEEQEELLWQQFVHRVRALEKQQRARSCSPKKVKKKKLLQNHHHCDDSALFVAIKQDHTNKTEQQDASVRMPLRVQSPTSTQPTVSSSMSSSNSPTTRRQRQQQQAPAAVVAVSSSPNIVMMMAAATAHSSSTPTTSPSSSCCYTNGGGSPRGSQHSSNSSEIPPPPPPRSHHCGSTTSQSLLRKKRDTSTTAVECKIAGIVGNDRLWLGDDDDDDDEACTNEQTAKTALSALYQTFVDENHVIIPKNCHVAYRLGAPLVVVQVMARHNASAKIQQYGCELLACLSSCCCQQQQQQQQKQQQRHSYPSYLLNKKDQKRGQQEQENESFLKLGGLWRVLRAMEVFRHNPAVLGPACWFIGNVVDQALVQQAGMAESCLRATIAAMTMHPTSIAVQEYGCYVLRNFIVRAAAPGSNKLGAQRVVDAGGIECIIAAMLHHDVNIDVDVLTEGCTVLTKLAEMNLPNHVRRIIQAQGLAALSEIIRMYQKQPHDVTNKDKDSNNNNDDDDDGASAILVEKASRAMHSILLVQSLSASLSSSGEVRVEECK